jgi:hypothetical protein
MNLGMEKISLSVSAAYLKSSPAEQSSLRDTHLQSIQTRGTHDHAYPGDRCYQRAEVDENVVSQLSSTACAATYARPTH